MKYRKVLYGYVIEVKYKWKSGVTQEVTISDWCHHYNNKIYHSKHVAEEALSYIKNAVNPVDYRIKPLYQIIE